MVCVTRLELEALSVRIRLPGVWEVAASSWRLCFQASIGALAGNRWRGFSGTPRVDNRAVIVSIIDVEIVSWDGHGMVKKVLLFAVDKVEKTSIGYLFERYNVNNSTTAPASTPAT